MSALKYKPLLPSRVKYLVIHQSGAEHEEGETAADIDRAHRLRGLLQIGYHYVIRRDGTVEPGRPLEIPGAHVRGFNQFSVGVCLIGKLGEFPTDAQARAVTELANQLAANYPAIVMVGHQDLAGATKACPGFDVKGLSGYICT